MSERVPTSFETGDRVAYVKTQIEDVPKGTLGTVIGYTRPSGGSIIVSFDGIKHNRYMPRSHIRLAPRDAPPSSCDDGR